MSTARLLLPFLFFAVLVFVALYVLTPAERTRARRATLQVFVAFLISAAILAVLFAFY